MLTVAGRCAVGGLVVALLSGGCAAPSDQVLLQSGNAGGVGELEPKSEFVLPAYQPTPPLLGDEVDIDRSCESIEAATGVTVPYLQDPPPGATGICYVEGPDRPAEADAADGPASAYLHVLYVPDGIVAARTSYEDILDAGGIDVNVALHHVVPADLPQRDDRDNVAGGYAVFDAGNGNNGLVQRLTERRVVGSWITQLRGLSGPVLVVVRGDHSPDAVVEFVRGVERRSAAARG